MSVSKIRVYVRVEGGMLDGTIIEQNLAFIIVSYPHRKAKDTYIALKPQEGQLATVRCCQDCATPDFPLSEFLDHLELHAGRLKKRFKEVK